MTPLLRVECGTDPFDFAPDIKRKLYTSLHRKRPRFLMMTSPYGSHTRTRPESSSKQAATFFLKAKLQGVPTNNMTFASYEHAILGSRRMTRPNLSRGGILADDMGLGKTLTMISAILISLNEARTFMCSQNHVNIASDAQKLLRSSATLVIAPSAGRLSSPWPCSCSSWLMATSTSRWVARRNAKVRQIPPASLRSD